MEMPKEDKKVLKYKHGEKSFKILFIIYANMQSFHDKIATSHNNPEKSSTTKINKQNCFWLFIIYTLFI